MFEAYKIGVSLVLEDRVSVGLLAIGQSVDSLIGKFDRLAGTIRAAASAQRAYAKAAADAISRAAASAGQPTPRPARGAPLLLQAPTATHGGVTLLPAVSGGGGVPPAIVGGALGAYYGRRGRNERFMGDAEAIDAGNGGGGEIPPGGGRRKGGGGDFNALYAGTLAAGTGYAGVRAVGNAIKPAEEYVHQLNIMNMAGMKQAEIADAVGDAWKLAGQNITTTATGNLKALLDLRNVTGDWKEAREFLPIMQRMQAVLAASKEGHVSGHADDLAFSAMKALDIRGAVNDPEALKRQADLMTRVIVGTQGRVTPEQFQSVFNYARQAKFSLSDDFAYKYLPTLMLENASKGGGGGGSKGLGPALAAMFRVTNQGFINRKALPEWMRLGEVRHGSALKTSTPGTVVAPLVDAALARSNPLLFNDLLVEKIRKQYGSGVSDDFISSKLAALYRGNQLAAGLALEMFVKRKNFERDKNLMEGVMSPEDAYKSAMTKDPTTAHRALDAAWNNFQTSLTVNVVPVLVPALLDLAKGLNTLGDWARRHPNMARDAVMGFSALSAVLGVGGSLVTGIAVTRVAFGGLGKSATAAGQAIEGAGGLLSKLAKGLGSLSAAAAPFLAMWSVKNWAQDTTHDHDRINTLRSWSDAVKGMLPKWMANPAQGATDRYMLMRGELDGSGGDYVRPQRGGAATAINNKIVMPDGRVLAEVVTNVQAREASRPVSRAAGFDRSMGLTPVSMGYMP